MASDTPDRTGMEKLTFEVSFSGYLEPGKSRDDLKADGYSRLEEAAREIMSDHSMVNAIEVLVVPHQDVLDQIEGQ